MTRRALLIGAQTGDLTGTEEDLRRMQRALKALHFDDIDIDVRRGTDASRRGILDGIAQLTERTGPDDVAVLYYTGHAAHGFNTSPKAGHPDHPDVPLRLQFIIPTDYDRDAEDFRGMTSWELTHYMADLAEKSANVTAIFDCCYAAHMSRDAAARRLRAKALPFPQRVGLAKYLAELRKRGYRFDRMRPEGHPLVVRLFATESTMSAYEHTSDQGERGGVFTEAFTDVLTAIGDEPISWDVIGKVVRERVLAAVPEQRADMAGPIGRAPFTLHEPARSRAVPIAVSEGRTLLRAGRITGVARDDVYAVMPAAVTAYDPTRELARATVTHAGALDAEVALSPDIELPSGALAFPVQQHLTRYLVRVEGTGDAAARLRTAIAAAPRLHLEADESELLAIVRASDADVVVADGVGDLIAPRPWGGNPDQVRQLVVDFLSDLATARAFRALAGAHELPASCCVVEWGTVEGGKPVVQPEQGAMLSLGDTVYVRVENRSDRDVHVHLFNVGVRGKVTRLSGSLGELVLAGKNITFGAVPGAGLTGFRLDWPEGLPVDTPRRDEIVVVATSRAADLGALETVQAITRSPERSVLAQGFVLVLRSFQLHPAPGRIAARESDFQIDDNPRATRAALATRAWRSAAGATEVLGAGPDHHASIAIRLSELAVHCTGGIGSANLRLDALVCTPTHGGALPYTAQTLRWPGVVDGAGGPFCPAELYRGPVHDFVDICLWLSPDAGPPLAALLATAAGTPEVEAAVAALAAAAEVPGWVGAVGASAVLARVAHRALASVTGAAGLYRTSFLATERFGIGRHAATGTHCAGDVRFAVDIAPDVAPPR